MDRVVILADHEIGYRLTEYLLTILKSENVASFKICHVFSNDTSDNSWWRPVHTLLNRFDFSYSSYTKEKLQKIIENIECDYLLLLSWKYIIPQSILNMIKFGAINLHYSLLPRHRGVYPVNWAIQSGDKETGITYHFVDSYIDEGEIILQKSMKIDICDDASSLLFKLDDLAYLSFQDIWQSRSTWKQKAFKQSGTSSYNSRDVFLSTNKLALNQKLSCSQFIQLLKAKTFGNQRSNAFFLDPDTGEKIFVSIHLHKEES